MPRQSFRGFPIAANTRVPGPASQLLRKSIPTTNSAHRWRRLSVDVGGRFERQFILFPLYFSFQPLINSSPYSVSQQFHVATLHMHLPLAATMTMLLCARKRTHVIHQAPNVIRCLHLAEGWHSCVSDSVLDNPKQLLIGIALNFLTREVRCAGVHPPSRWGLGAAVNSVACAAIQAVMCSSAFAAGFYVYWSWRCSVAARSANGKVLGLIHNARFKRAGFLQRRQPELHHSNPD